VSLEINDDNAHINQVQPLEAVPSKSGNTFHLALHNVANEIVRPINDTLVETLEPLHDHPSQVETNAHSHLLNSNVYTLTDNLMVTQG